MPCKVCQHTVQRLTGPPNGWFWCARCGTLHLEKADEPGELRDLVESPKLVDRAKCLIEAVSAIKTGDCWCGVGIGNPMYGGKHAPLCTQMQAMMVAMRESVGLPLRPDKIDLATG